jgi:biopolymer transport protein ExbB
MSSILNLILLQATAQEEFTILSLLEKGGYVMYPILFLFSVAVFLFIERYLYIRKTTKIDENFLHNINELLLAGNIQAAVTYCKNSKFPIANMLERGLGRLGSPIREIESAIENKAKLEIYNMEKNLGILSSIARIAPMFGFLGTVTGMIHAFGLLGASELGAPTAITGGIAEALIATAFGLLIAMISLLPFNYLNTQLEAARQEMENVGAHLELLLLKSEKDALQKTSGGL